MLYKNYKKLIFEYDESFNNIRKSPFELFKEFYKEIYPSLLLSSGKDDTLIIKYVNNKFSSEAFKGNLKRFKNEDKINLFEIICYFTKNNNKEEIIINIKKYLEKSIKFISMNEVNKKIQNLKKDIKQIKENNSIQIQKIEKNCQKEMEKNKMEHQKELEKTQKEMENNKMELEKTIKKLEKTNKEMETNKKQHKKEIERVTNQVKELKNKLQSIEEKYYYLKGRFIYKNFYDYLLLIFGVPIDKNIKEKEDLLKKKMKELNINSDTLNYIIHDMKQQYKNQTLESHWLPKEEEIREYILYCYNENDEETTLLEKFFKICGPEKEIIELIRINNELTRNNLSLKNQGEKEKDKKTFNEQINNILNEKRKKELLEIIRKII